MTNTITDPLAANAAEQDRPGTQRLWISSAVSPYGNPYGAVAVIAETRAQAVAKVRQELADRKGGYVPADRYAKNILENLEEQLTEVASGVLIDWDAVYNKRR
jgi:hypothetical protein